MANTLSYGHGGASAGSPHQHTAASSTGLHPGVNQHGQQGQLGQHGFPPHKMPGNAMALHKAALTGPRTVYGGPRTVMGRGINGDKFQPWLTLMGTGGGAAEDVIQPISQWLNGQGVKAYNFRVQVLGVNAATLTLESSPTVEGPWQSCGTYTAVTNTPLALSAEGGSNTFSAFVRWRVQGTGAWSICFQLRSKVAGTTSDSLVP